MTSTTEPAQEPQGRDRPEPTAVGAATAAGPSKRVRPGPQARHLGLVLRRVVVAAIFVAIGLGAVSEIVLPMTFAAVLAICFKPLMPILERHGVKPSLAAGLIVLGLLALMTGILVATVRGVADQADQIGNVTDQAIDKAAQQSTWRVSIRPHWRTPGRLPRARPPRSAPASSPKSSPESGRSSGWSAASSSAC